jgi:proteasome lid subunit RPN8/RPN11
MTITDLNNPAHIGHSNYLISTNGKRAEQIFHPDVPLLESTVHELIEELQGHYLERCGFIDSEMDLFHVQNSHRVPHSNFYMEETDESVEQALHEIYEIRQTHIIGIYHTHPNGYPWPTPRDIAGWPNTALGWRYFLVTRGEVTEWRLVSD